MNYQLSGGGPILESSLMEPPFSRQTHTNAKIEQNVKKGGRAFFKEQFLKTEFVPTVIVEN